ALLGDIQDLPASLLRQPALLLVEGSQFMQQAFLGAQADAAAEITDERAFWVVLQYMQEFQGRLQAPSRPDSIVTYAWRLRTAINAGKNLVHGCLLCARDGRTTPT